MNELLRNDPNYQIFVSNTHLEPFEVEGIPNDMTFLVTKTINGAKTNNLVAFKVGNVNVSLVPINKGVIKLKRLVEAKQRLIELYKTL